MSCTGGPNAGLGKDFPSTPWAPSDVAVQGSRSSLSQRIAVGLRTRLLPRGRNCTDYESLHSKDAPDTFMTSVKKWFTQVYVNIPVILLTDWIYCHLRG